MRARDRTARKRRGWKRLLRNRRRVERLRAGRGVATDVDSQLADGKIEPAGDLYTTRHRPRRVKGIVGYRPRDVI